MSTIRLQRIIVARSKMGAQVYSGSQFGTVLSLPISGRTLNKNELLYTINIYFNNISSVKRALNSDGTLPANS